MLLIELSTGLRLDEKEKKTTVSKVDDFEWGATDHGLGYLVGRLVTTVRRGKNGPLYGFSDGLNALPKGLSASG